MPNDHTMIARLLASGKMRWEPWNAKDGELCFDGIRYATELDRDGVPRLPDVLRHAIIRSEAK